MVQGYDVGKFDLILISDAGIKSKPTVYFYFKFNKFLIIKDKKNLSGQRHSIRHGESHDRKSRPCASDAIRV